MTWLPTSERELREAIESGVVEENHHLDFKRELGSSPSALKETARDLASFALDGGVLIIGVDEPTAGHFELLPIPLADASERAELIADNRPDPGLHIRSTVINSAERPGFGYLVIEVPPSPGAPHMVDGRYYARSERTKRQLADAEVVRLHAVRGSAEERVRAALQEERDRQPFPQPNASMVLVAEPLAAPAGVARDFVRGQPRDVVVLVNDGEAIVPASVAAASPNPSDLNSAVRRAKGLALTNLANGRVLPDFMDEEGPTDIELNIDGSVRVLVTRLTYTGTTARIAGEVPFLLEALPIAWAYRLVGYASRLRETLPYRGPWGFGIHLTGLDGVRAHAESGDFTGYQRPVYDEEEYEFVTVASGHELTDAPHQIVERLLGDLIHALGVSDRYAEELTGPAKP